MHKTIFFQIFLVVIGVALLAGGLNSPLLAAVDDGAGLQISYNDLRLAAAVNVVLTYIEGSFGALIMVVAGLVAIISAAFGQYRAAISALVVAVGAFILRSILSTFFNDVSIQP